MKATPLALPVNFEIMLVKSVQLGPVLTRPFDRGN